MKRFIVGLFYSILCWPVLFLSALIDSGFDFKDVFEFMTSITYVIINIIMVTLFYVILPKHNQRSYSKDLNKSIDTNMIILKDDIEFLFKNSHVWIDGSIYITDKNVYIKYLLDCNKDKVEEIIIKIEKIDIFDSYKVSYLECTSGNNDTKIIFIKSTNMRVLNKNLIDFQQRTTLKKVKNK